MNTIKSILLGCVLNFLLLWEQVESYPPIAKTVSKQQNYIPRRLSQPSVGKMPRLVRPLNKIRDRALRYRTKPTRGETENIFGFSKKNPEVDMDASQLVTSKGYPFEKHEVVTDDGYILTLFRIPHGLKNKDKKGPRPAVLLQHAMISSADDWLVNPANQSLGFLLADAGADVWLANNRGNRYSREHIRLSPEDRDFWKFSLDEMAKYDLPAEINFILDKTNQEQIYYVGYSQGTTLGFAAFSENPELQSKIKHFLALAPVARVRNTISALRLLVPFASSITEFSEAFGTGEFNIPDDQLKHFATNYCQDWGAEICKNFLFLICGFNYDSLNTTRLDVYLSHVPAGTSTRSVLHWAQGVKSGQFQHFDYGRKDNRERYFQDKPPRYDPRKVTVPVAVFRGGQDWLAVKDDVNWLLKQLEITHDIYVPYYEHLDLIYGVDAVDQVYPVLIKIVMGEL